MIALDHAEINWQLNSHCQLQCSYCRPEFKNGGLDFSLDQYLLVVEKLQQTIYQHHSKTLWKISGGEPLNFPNLTAVLKKIKSKPAIVHIETSGDDNWFSFLGPVNYIDKLTLTYHHWQTDDVVDFILEQCKEKNIEVDIVVPLAPGFIFESKEKVQHFLQLGYQCREQILYDNDGRLHQQYTSIDENRIYGRNDDYVNVPVTIPVGAPDPNYISLAVVNKTDPVYTGKPCYAGIDWMQINAKGFVSYSQCGGRTEHYNIFDTNWQPPAQPFPCNINQCRSSQDRSKIRVKGS